MSRLELKSNKGMTAAETRSFLKSSSPMRAAGVLILPSGEKIEVLEHTDIAQFATARAMAEGLMVNAGPNMNILKGTDPKDILAMYEKEYYLQGIANGDFKGSIKDTSGRYGPAIQNDHFSLSFDNGEDQATIDRTKEIVLESLRSLETRLFIDDKGNVPDSISAANGKRMIYVTEQHDTTGNPHFHFVVNRFAFDPETKEVASGVNLSKVGVYQSTLDMINDKLAAENLPLLEGARAASKVQTSSPVINQQTQDNLSETLEKAGALSSDSIAKMPVVSIEISALDQSERIIRDSMTRRQAQIDALVRQQEEEAALVVLAQNAKAALAENAVLKDQVQEQSQQLSELSTNLEQTNTAKAEVEQKHQVLEEQHQELSAQHQSVVADLEQKVTTLSEVEEAVGNYLDNPEEFDGAYEQISAIGDKMTEAQKEVEAKAIQIDELTEQNGKLAETIKDKDQVIEAKDQAINDMQTQMAELQKQMEALQAQITKQNEKLVTAERVENTLRNIVVNQTGDNSYMSKGAEEAAERLSIRFQEMRQETVRVATERDSLQTQLTVVSEQIGKLSQEKAQLTQTNAQLKEEVQATEKLAERLDKENATLRQAVNQLQGVQAQEVSNNAGQAREKGKSYTPGLQELADKAQQGQNADKKKDLNQDDDLSKK